MAEGSSERGHLRDAVRQFNAARLADSQIFAAFDTVRSKVAGWFIVVRTIMVGKSPPSIGRDDKSNKIGFAWPVASHDSIRRIVLERWHVNESAF
jgi:hypothetical protein